MIHVHCVDTIATAILTEACVRRMDLISHLALMTLTFLAVGIFGDLPERRRANVRERERTGTGVESAAGLALLAMLFPMLVLAPTPARAVPRRPPGELRAPGPAHEP